jgi:hypothetical protein
MVAAASAMHFQYYMGNASLKAVRLLKFWIYISAAALAFMLFTKRIKWRGREIFELAAAPVEDTENGFTERPLAAGTLEYSKRQLLSFADFLRSHLIAMEYAEEDGIFFTPVLMGREYGYLFNFARDYRKDTWVRFDYEGNVTVNISKRDYLQYDEDLSFDQLCDSMGALFIEFFELYRKGKGMKVIDRLNNVGLGPFS